MFDNGFNPSKNESESDISRNAEVRKEYAAVIYAANVLGSRGPRKMQVDDDTARNNTHYYFYEKLIKL